MEDQAAGEKTLLEWESAERVFNKKGKEYFQILFALLFIGAMIAVFFREFLLALVLGAFGLFQYAAGRTPPVNTKHKVTNHGVVTHGHTYDWDDLKSFWFSESGGEGLLNIDTKRAFPGRLFLLLGSADKGKISSILKEHIPQRKRPPEDPLAKWSSSISRRIKLS
jgi:hypothetical protein